MLQNVKTLIAIELLLTIGLGLYRLALAGDARRAVDARAVGITMLTPAVALLSGSPYLFYLYLVVAVAFNSRSRAELCSIYLLMLPMTPLLIQEAGAGGVYLLPLSTVSAMNLGALIGVATTRGGRSLANPVSDVAALLLVLLFTYVDGRGVSIISIGRSLLIFFITFGGPYLMASRGITRRQELDRALLRLALAAFLAALIAVFQTGRHWILYQSFYEALHVSMPLGSATLGMRGGRLRTGGPLVDYSVAGVFFAATIMLLPYLKSRFRPGLYWGVVLTVVAGLFVTQSRGAWTGAALGFAAVLVYRRQFGRAVVLAGVAVLLRFVLFLSLSDTSRLAETFGKSGQSTWTADYRRKLLTRGLDQVRSHPILGQSPKQLVANLPDLVQGQHIVDFVNSHLYVAMAAGLPWFVAWVAIWSWPVVRAWGVRRAAPADSNPAEVPVGMIAATMVAVTFTSTVDRNLIWPTIALALSGPCVALARGGATRRVSAPAPRRKLVVGLPSRDEAPLAVR